MGTDRALRSGHAVQATTRSMEIRRRHDVHRPATGAHSLERRIALIVSMLGSGLLSDDGRDSALEPSAPVASDAHVAFVRSTFDNLIHIADADGSHSVLLAAGYGPAWSPDGHRLAFSRRSETLRNGTREWVSDVWVMNVDGSDQRRLAAGENPDWSPDGTRILFTGSHGQMMGAGNLLVISAEGSGVTPVRHDAPAYPACSADVYAAAWSPEGGQLLLSVVSARCLLRVGDPHRRPFAGDRQPAAGLLRQRPDGRVALGLVRRTASRRTVSHWHHARSTVCCARTARFGFLRTFTDTPERYAMPKTDAFLVALILALGSLLESGCESSLGPVPAEAPEPADPPPVKVDPSPVKTDPGPLPAEASGPPGIYVAGAGGEDITRLTAGNRPAFSPDGRSIAFERAGVIHVIDAGGTNEVRLLPGREPAWSPDGAKIVFAEGVGFFTDGISVMNADGTVATRLISSHAIGPSDAWGVGRPAWSPDGRYIAFEHYGNDMWPTQIWVMNADGSGAHRLTNERGIQYAESDPAWSPDGTLLAFWSYGFGIATAGPEGGADPKTIYMKFPFVAYGAKPVWSAEGNTIVFTGGRFSISPAESIYRVRKHSALWGAPELLIRNAYDPSWSPDGRQIVFVHGRPEG